MTNIVVYTYTYVNNILINLINLIMQLILGQYLNSLINKQQTGSKYHSQVDNVESKCIKYQYTILSWDYSFFGDIP